MGTGYNGSALMPSGYGVYNGTNYTSGAPLVITEGSKVKLLNNAASAILGQLPDGQRLWDSSTNKITPINSGDSYVMRVDFTAANTSNTGAIELTLNIGGTQGDILAIPSSFIRGVNVFRRFTTSSLIFTLDTFIQNGGELYLESIRGTTSLYDLTIVLARVHEAK